MPERIREQEIAHPRAKRYPQQGHILTRGESLGDEASKAIGDRHRSAALRIDTSCAPYQYSTGPEAVRSIRRQPIARKPVRKDSVHGSLHSGRSSLDTDPSWAQGDDKCVPAESRNHLAQERRYDEASPSYWEKRQSRDLDGYRYKETPRFAHGRPPAELPAAKQHQPRRPPPVARLPSARGQPEPPQPFQYREWGERWRTDIPTIYNDVRGQPVVTGGRPASHKSRDVFDQRQASYMGNDPPKLVRRDAIKHYDPSSAVAKEKERPSRKQSQQKKHSPPGNGSQESGSSKVLRWLGGT